MNFPTKPGVQLNGEQAARAWTSRFIFLVGILPGQRRLEWYCLRRLYSSARTWVLRRSVEQKGWAGKSTTRLIRIMRSGCLCGVGVNPYCHRIVSSPAHYPQLCSFLCKAFRCNWVQELGARGTRKAWQTIKEGADLQWQFHFKADLEPGFMICAPADRFADRDGCCVLNDWVEVWELGRVLEATERRSSSQSYLLGWKWGRRGRAS